MTITNNAEGGSNGTAVTTGNSGGSSGTAFLTVSAGAGGTIQFNTATKMHGALAYAFTPGAGTANYVVFNDSGSGTVNFSFRCYMYLTGNPTSETQWLTVQTSAGAAIVTCNLTTTGNIKVVSATPSTLGTFTNAIPLNTWTRITITGTSNATTGAVTVKMYAGDSGTVTETQSFTNANLNGSVVNRIVIGKLTATGNLAAYYVDDIALDVSSNTEIGVPSLAAPTVTNNSGTQNVSAASTVNLSYTSSDTDGTVTGVATTFDFPTSGAPALTGGTTATPSFTAGSAPNLYVVRQTATDNDGLTGYATAEVRVPTSSDWKPLSGYTPVTTGTWTNQGGAANIAAAVADASDTTYAESAALSASSQEIRWRLEPATARSAGSITFRVAQDTAGTIVAKGRLYEGNTLRQEWTLTTTTSAADQVCTISAGTIAAITDWGNLWAAVAGTA
jgi:hypothetical protein